ncbi:cytochrome P450 monooxygenase [Xylaria cf. heliscus]|nr:cytochrome P450 monooxygenase [Xylaria cf. heliscus]
MAFPSIFNTSWATASALMVITAVLFVQRLYRALLPKPLPGIPYNEASMHRILGDVPAIMEHMACTEGGTFITYILKTMRELDSPLIQVFIRPLSKPLLILGDFPEANDLLMRRKDFDRSHTLGDLVKGLAPDHHIHLVTGEAWKAQRQLVQDLMTPSFLHTIAAPVIYQHVVKTIDLWKAKCRVADGRPWSAGDDVNQMALDAVTAFAFGEEFHHNATQPALDAVKNMSEEAISIIKRTDLCKPVEFPKGQEDHVLEATRELTKTVGEVQGNPLPALTWALVTRRPRIKRAIRIKEDYIMEQLKSGVRRLEETSGRSIKSAVDQMVVRESDLSQRDKRAPNYFSRVMVDEVFGFVFAGHETTSTTLCWSLKYLSDHPTAQSDLRSELRSAFPAAWVGKRNPTIQEITSTSIPYLDATMEETLRCCGTAPVVDRVAMNDTELLGHRIPKGTVVTCLVTGPSMMTPPFDIDISRRNPSSQLAIKEGRQRAWDPQDISAFNPSRWLKRCSSEEGFKFDPASGPQLAFGLGTRGCYGKRLVYLEMRIVLTLIFWNFELLECPSGLSGYHSKLITTNEPTQTYVRLCQISPQ